MTSLKKTVWSLVACLAFGLGVCACGSESGNEANSPPITVIPVPAADAGEGCPGSFGCACSPSEPCTQPKMFCTGQGICLPKLEPCGNCNSHNMN